MPQVDRQVPASGASVPGRPPADIAAASHPGRKRSSNQDAWSNAAQIGLVVVADGVGGQGDGSWASTKCVKLVRGFVERAARWLKPANVQARELIVSRALQFAHLRLRHGNLGRPFNAASGTTIVGVWAPDGERAAATAFNVGDSRLFLLSPRGLDKLSKDHSLHQLWLDGGEVGAEPSKRVIVQAMGISSPLTPHIISFTVGKGDTLLACTDGLTGTVPSNRIADLLRAAASAGAGAQALIEEALSGPAPDNITAAVYRF